MRVVVLSGMVVIFVLIRSALASLYSVPQRFGISYDYKTVSKPISYYDYKRLGHFGWYADGESNYPGCAGPVVLDDGWTIDRILLVGKDASPPKANAAQTLVRNHPDWFDLGSAWQIGGRLGIDTYTQWPNSEDPRYWQVDNYVSNFHEWHEQIKAVNADFRILSGAIIPGRKMGYRYDNHDFLKQAIKKYYAEYHQPMPIDIFTLQIFVPPATGDPLADLKSAVGEFRQWMTSVQLADGVFHNYRASELWITAYGLEDPSISEPLAIEYMEQTTTWFLGEHGSDIFDSACGLVADENRLIQRWAWYPIDRYSVEYHSAGLFDQAGQITAMGQAYADLITQHVPEPASMILLMVGIVIWKWSSRQ